MGPLAFILVGGLLYFQVDGKFPDVCYCVKLLLMGIFINNQLCFAQQTLSMALQPASLYPLLIWKQYCDVVGLKRTSH